MAVKVNHKGLVAGDKLIPLISGTMHYWRIQRDRWESILDMVAELGFKVVETYVPWSAHETGRGRFDFGEDVSELAFGDFISACHDRGLHLLVRPGPHINAEITCFGYPERVLRQPECLSVSVDGDPVWMPTPPKMWPAPSYASEAFYEEVGLWFDALAPHLKSGLYPEGPIIGIQVDNEFSNLFRNSAWDHDYHPDALRLWRRFLVEKYGEEEAAREAPRGFLAETRDDLPACLDWIEFKEYYMRNALARFRSMWEERGIGGIPVFHNYPVGHDVPPNNYTELERVLDFQGPDMYPSKRQYFSQKSLVCFASGLSRFPCIPEFSSGGFFWSTPLTVRDQEFTTPVCFMHGIKGINFYMLVERERWYGSPITRDGRKRPAQWDLYVDFNKWRKKTRINELDKVAGALLLSVRDYERLALAATLLDPAPPLAPYVVKAEAHCAEDRFGFKDAIQIAHEQQWQSLFYGLSAAKIPFDLGNTSQPADALKKYPLVLCPTFEFLDSGVQARLVEYAEAGGTLLIGPRLPGLDAGMKPCAILKDACENAEDLPGEKVKTCKCGKGMILIIGSQLPKASAKDRPEQTTKMLTDVAERFGVPRPYPAADPMIETVLHQDEKDAVLFVANPTRDDRVAVMETGGKTLVDVQSRERFEGRVAKIPMRSYSVRILMLDA